MAKYGVKFFGSGQEDGKWDQILPVLKEYAVKLKTNIVAEYFSGDIVPPKYKKDTLFIYFWATPSVGLFTYDISQPNSEEDCMFDGNSFGPPSLIGLRITEESQKVSVAEILEGTIYVLIDLSYIDGSEMDIMKSIMNGYEKMPSITERRKGSARIKKELETESFNNFIELFRQEEGGLLERNLNQIKARYNALLKEAKGKVLVLEDEIRVGMGRASLEIDRKIRDIGEWLLVISPKDDVSPIQLFCLTPDLKYSHPNAGGAGYVCLGNISDGVQTLIDEKEFAFAVTVMREFLTKDKG